MQANKRVLGLCFGAAVLALVGCASSQKSAPVDGGAGRAPADQRYDAPEQESLAAGASRNVANSYQQASPTAAPPAGPIPGSMQPAFAPPTPAAHPGASPPGIPDVDGGVSNPNPPAAPVTGEAKPGSDEPLAHTTTTTTPPTPTPVQPGLATSWGETLSSQVTTAAFARADRTKPFATAIITYNDAEGIAAMSDVPSNIRIPRSLFAVQDGFVELGLRDGAGQFLTGFSAHSDNFVTGRAGERYTIFVRNHSPGRVETVVSVDGLDVVDGKPASFGKRGYILDPNGMVEIEGFRTSEASVAAFRFGSVRDSYASRKHGDTRNVGVIGAAFFHEQGDDPLRWSSWRNEDAIRRQNANPFPAQFATPAP